MKYLTFFFAFILFTGCGSKKNEPKSGSSDSAAVTGMLFSKDDCRENLEMNIVRCYEELKKAKQSLDSNLVYDYCECVNREIVNIYSCEQIRSMKKLTEIEQFEIYRPIKFK